MAWSASRWLVCAWLGATFRRALQFWRDRRSTAPWKLQDYHKALKWASGHWAWSVRSLKTEWWFCGGLGAQGVFSEAIDPRPKMRLVFLKMWHNLNDRPWHWSTWFFALGLTQLFWTNGLLAGRSTSTRRGKAAFTSKRIGFQSSLPLSCPLHLLSAYVPQLSSTRWIQRHQHSNRALSSFMLLKLLKFICESQDVWHQRFCPAAYMKQSKKGNQFHCRLKVNSSTLWALLPAL